MKTKTIPFDLETAKKIQAGEIEGRIMYNGKNGGEEVIILSYDNKKYQDYSIRFAYVNYDEIDYLFDTSSFYIELPEETPKHNSFTKKLHDTAEVLATPKHEFKVGDKVRIHCEGDLYDNEIGEVVDVFTNTLRVRVKALPFSYKINEVEFISHDRVDNSVTIESSKREFKPFDKVLVRDNDDERWRCSLFSHYSYEDAFIYTCIGESWTQCIPYEGNEHLVGTIVNTILKEE